MIQQNSSDRLLKVGGFAALSIPLFYVVAGAITGVGYRVSPVPSDVGGCPSQMAEPQSILR